MTQRPTRAAGSQWIRTVLLLTLGAIAAGPPADAAHRAKSAAAVAPAVPPPAASAVPTPAFLDAAAVDVRVERIRPQREKNPTLRFLKANRDFLRAQFDLLHQRPGSRPGGSQSVDPRFLAYQRLIAEARSAGDSLAAADQSEGRRTLFQSVTELSMLEAQFDQMDRLLAEQRQRLGSLQSDFAGRQRTTLAIVVTGFPAQEPLSSLGLKFEDGDSLTVAISAEQRQSLQLGGVLEIFHGLVEPREQVFQVVLAGRGQEATPAGWITLDPERDRLTCLRLNLSPVHTFEGAAGMTASTWVLNAISDASDGAEKQP